MTGLKSTVLIKPQLSLLRILSLFFLTLSCLKSQNKVTRHFTGESDYRYCIVCGHSVSLLFYLHSFYLNGLFQWRMQLDAYYKLSQTQNWENSDVCKMRSLMFIFLNFVKTTLRRLILVVTDYFIAFRVKFRQYNLCTNSEKMHDCHSLKYA